MDELEKKNKKIIINKSNSLRKENSIEYSSNYFYFKLIMF